MEDVGKNSCEEILKKLHSIENENETLNLENTKLKVMCSCVYVDIMSNDNFVEVAGNNSMLRIVLSRHFVLYVFQGSRVS